LAWNEARVSLHLGGIGSDHFFFESTMPSERSSSGVISKILSPTAWQDASGCEDGELKMEDGASDMDGKVWLGSRRAKRELSE
jgi:hypothetical protein